MRLWKLIQLMNLRYLRRQWIRAIIALLGTVMGVTTFVFLPSLTTALSQSLELTVNDLSGKADIEVRAAEGGIEFATLDPILTAEGVKVAAPLAQTGGLMLGSSELLAFFGIDPVVDQQIRTYHLANGAFLSGTGEVLLGEPYAQEQHLKVGDSITLISAGGAKVLTIVGTLKTDEGVARLNGGDLLIMSLEDAFALRGGRKIDTISIIGSGDSAALADHLKTLVPATVRVERPADLLKGASEFQTFINMMLTVIGLIILGFGSLLIYNVINVSIAQRRAEIGMLRALGSTRSDIRWQFVLESGVLGVLGSCLGVPLGYLMVSLGSNLPLLPEWTTSSAVNTRAGVSVPLWVPIAAFISGTLVALVAGYVASHNAAKVDPVEAMSNVQADITPGRIRRWQVIVPIAIVAVILVVRALPRPLPLQAAAIWNVLMMGIIVGVIIAFNPYITSLGRVLPQWMYRVGGVTGRLAAENVTRRKRTTMISLMVTLGILLGGVVGESLFGYSDFVTNWNKSENIAQITVLGAGADPFNPTISIPNAIVEEIAMRSDVSAVIPERRLTLQIDGTSYLIRALDIDAYRANGGSFVINSGDKATMLDQLLDEAHPTVLVSSNMTSSIKGYMTGATLSLPTPMGTQSFTIAATTLGTIETDRITVVMDRALYLRLWKDTRVDRMQIVLKPDADVQQVRRDLLRKYAMSGIVAFDNAEVNAIFISRMASISNVASLLIVLISVILLGGLGSMMFVAVLDRRREIGMLRAVGMLRQQMNRTIVLEVVLMVVVGTVIAIPTIMLTAMAQEAILQQMIGIQLTTNWAHNGLVLLAILILCVGAALIPARQAGKMDVLEALRYE
ncbi:MAG: FtsX-like permease family protein [Anaerolineae bacterium]|nr:FtsX-like permease family protein [Anaerolineae bacterium]